MSPNCLMGRALHRFIMFPERTPVHPYWLIASDEVCSEMFIVNETRCPAQC